MKNHTLIPVEPNFISLVKSNQPDCAIDFYEYYWAYKMEGEITFQELVEWLIKTSDGAGIFYSSIQKICNIATKEYTL